MRYTPYMDSKCICLEPLYRGEEEWTDNAEHLTSWTWIGHEQKHEVSSKILNNDGQTKNVQCRGVVQVSVIKGEETGIWRVFVNLFDRRH